MPNYVTSLNNYVQKRGELSSVTYTDTSSGPDNEPIWTVECKIDGNVQGTGKGPTKADAKQAAAKEALSIAKKLNGGT